ncbi:MAG: hypothetical protein KF855_13365 [Acidobacteria bacterium]|nr:hypothetical protein [Acidobacteriota bacterium]
MLEKPLSNSDRLAQEFLAEARRLHDNVDPIRVLKSRTYKIGESHVLVRAASEGNRRYFFGINYIAIEEIANLDNPFVAFICGSLDRTMIVPAKVLFAQLPNISHDRNGEYKLTIDHDLNLVLAGRNNRLNCGGFINNWDSLSEIVSSPLETKTTAEESLHSILQGRLIEIGNIRGFQTYCPDKSKKFNERKLEDISTLQTCPELQFSDYSLLRQIDVIWFKPKGSYFVPEKAFEIELSTGVWSGVGRMATLMDYANVDLYVIANDAKKFRQVLTSLREYSNRYRFVANESLSQLYAAELNLQELRYDVGL